MHCSANVGPDGDTALFFGLSGTGKTTLSADPNRTLIGDDEHGWSERGVFNFEGGCYAKMIKLSKRRSRRSTRPSPASPRCSRTSPSIRATRIPNFDDGSRTENTRGAYPLESIPNASLTGLAPHPKNIVMLTADAFGVMPPIAKLTPAQAMYHFLSGYTAKVAGTERGVTEPSATFSTCFGAPFMPRHPSVYGELLKTLIATHGVDCWLVNTGWTGGAFGVGRRMPIRVTRALLTAALDGSLSHADFRTDANFGFAVPVSVPGVEASILDPRVDLGGHRGLRRAGAQAGRHVPGQLHQVRAPRRQRGRGRSPRLPPRGGVNAGALAAVERSGPPEAHPRTRVAVLRLHGLTAYRGPRRRP